MGKSASKKASRGHVPDTSPPAAAAAAAAASSGSVGVTFSGLFKGKLSELENKIDTDYGLMAILEDSEVINEKHRADIEAAPTRYQRVRRLLSILEIRDDTKVADFIIALFRTDQRHVVRTLSGVVCVDAELDESSVGHVKQTESRIVSRWIEVSANEQHDIRPDVDRILRRLGFPTKLLVMEAADNIALVFVCLTLSAVTRLRDLWSNEQLKDFVQELFTLLSDAREPVNINRLIWPQEHYEQCRSNPHSFQAVVPMHVDTNPPISPADEQYLESGFTRVIDIINSVKQKPSVKKLLKRLRDPSKHVKSDVEDQLTTEYKSALYRAGFPLSFRCSVAPMMARITVNDITLLAGRHGSSVVGYFLCKTDQSLYELCQMILSGFMHEVFTIILEMVAQTNVDVYVRAKDLVCAQLCLSSAQDQDLKSHLHSSFLESSANKGDILPSQKADVDSSSQSVVIRRQKTLVYSRRLHDSSSDMDSVDYDVRQQILLKVSRLILRSEVTADAYTRLASVCGRFYTVIRQKRFADSIKQTVKADMTRTLSTMKRLQCQLTKFIEPDFALLDQLLSLEVLTRRQYDDVRSETTVYRRTDALLDLLTTHDQYVKFIKALQTTGQQHVINFITQNGAISPEFGDVRPLDEGRMRKLTINGIHLLDRIDANPAFITELANVGCITWPQRDHIINIVQPRDRNDKLLEFITRRSVADFQNFIEVLSKYQSHLVPLLVTDGVVIGVHAELAEWSLTQAEFSDSDDNEDVEDDDSEDVSSVDVVSQADARIVSRWREVSANEKHEMRQDLMRSYNPWVQRRDWF